MRLTVKTGEVFEYVLDFKDPDGQTVDMTGWTIKSQIRALHNYELVSALNASWLDSTIGSLHIVAETPTADWPVDLLSWDIALLDQQQRAVYSETVTIDVQRGITV